MVGIVAHQVIRSTLAAPATRRAIRALGGASAHERRVARIAVRMFDLLASRHALGDDYRQVLQTAALIHDFARPQAGADHHRCGAQWILADESLLLTSWQRRAVAYLVRYHKGRVAEPGREEILARGDGRRRLRTLLGLLRAADALDSRRAPATAIIIRKTRRKLRIRCLTQGNLRRARALFLQRRKFTVLEETLDLRVKLRVSAA